MNILIKPIWVLVENSVQNEIGHESFGTFSALFSLVTILTIFADFGINHYLTNTIAKDKTEYQNIVPTLFTVRFLIVILFPFLVLVFGFLLNYSKNELILLFCIAITQALMHFVLFFRAKFQAFQDFIFDGFASVADKLILLIFVLLLLWYGIDLESFIYARFFAISFVFLLLLLSVILKYGSFKFNFSLPNIGKILKATFPFTLMTLLYSVNERIDMFMVERLSSNYEAGLYAGAYRWYDALMMFVWLIMPMFFSVFSNSNDRDKVVSTIKNGKVIIALPMIFIGSVLLFQNQFLFFLFDNSSVKEIEDMSNILSILGISFLFNAFFVLFGTYLNASGYVKIVNKVVLVCVLLNVTLNAIFIPQYGAISSAFTTVVSTSILSIGYLIIIKSKIEIDFKLFGKLLLLAGSQLIIFYLITSLFANLNWLYIISINLIIYLFLVSILGLFKFIKTNFS